MQSGWKRDENLAVTFARSKFQRNSREDPDWNDRKFSFSSTFPRIDIDRHTTATFLRVCACVRTRPDSRTSFLSISLPLPFLCFVWPPRCVSVRSSCTLIPFSFLLFHFGRPQSPMGEDYTPCPPFASSEATESAILLEESFSAALRYAPAAICIFG